jgi:exonuclease III
MLERLGYRAELRPSPWSLEPEQAAMQMVLLDGWVDAARQIAPEAEADLANWVAQRRRWIERGGSRVRVGHWDLLAWPDRV